jgi:hypothetical protein
LLTVVFLQILHVGRIEADRVLSIVDVLAECRESISFVSRSSMALSVDNFSCIAEIAMTMITVP